MKLRDLKGLGLKTEQCLIAVGILTPDDLAEIGAIRAFIKLRDQSNVKPSLNFLYALVGALEDEHWVKIAQKEKGRLLIELEGFKELEQEIKRGSSQ